MHTRSGNTETFPIAYRSRKAVAAGTWSVQEVERNDYRPDARHYTPRFRTVTTKRRAVAERVMLHMRTDGKRVRLINE